VLGRVIEPSDAVPGFTEAVVISDGLWRRQFGADPHVLGRRILVCRFSAGWKFKKPAQFCTSCCRKIRSKTGGLVDLAD
jgi:hypothetical protein